MLEACASLKQQSLRESLLVKWGRDDMRSKAIDYKIGAMLTLDNQPFSMVGDLGFVNLMQSLKPKYTLPHRKTFTDKILPTMYKTANNCIKDMINQMSYISFTTDFWSSGSDQFLSLTAHCIFQNFDAQVVVLHAEPFTERHTAVNINYTIDNMINEYKIPQHKIHSIVHDSASNMIKGIEDSHYSSLACFTHTTQLALSDCIFQQISVKNLEQKCKKIHTHFNSSYVAMSRLLELLGLFHSITNFSCVSSSFT